jgi:predicted  nucleic acid-binding Zn-ribbon protein
MSVRIDGQIEVLSNASEAAWDAVKALFALPPQQRSLTDFDILASGWATTGAVPRATHRATLSLMRSHAVPPAAPAHAASLAARRAAARVRALDCERDCDATRAAAAAAASCAGMGVATFTSLVAQRWSEWEEGRGAAAAARREEERRLLKRQEDLREWLSNLGLVELHERLVREGVDLDRLQYLTETDLIAMGVNKLAQRRALMAAVTTQQQYRTLMERIDVLEGENRTLREAHGQQGKKLAAATTELAEARGRVGTLTAELRGSQEQVHRLSTDGGSLSAQLDEMTTRCEAAEARADAFAADADELMAQLKAANDSQKGSLRELRLQINRETDGVRQRVRKLQGSAAAAAVAAAATGGGGASTRVSINRAQTAPISAAAEQPPLS